MYDKGSRANRAVTVMVTCLVTTAFLVACTAAPPPPAPTAPPAPAAKPAVATAAPEQKPAAPAATPTAPAKPAAAPAPAAKTIRIGAISPLTGPAASSGASVKRGMELAMEQINNAGGIRSMGGAKLELLHEDHQMKPDVAAGIAERLVQNERVSALFGAQISAVSLVTTQVAERLKVPHLVPMSTADEITERGFKYTFRVSSDNAKLGRDELQFLKWLVQNKGMKLQKIALLYEDTSMGQSAADAQKKVFTKQEGFDIVSDQSYSAQGRDFSALVTKLKAASPDVVLAASYVADAILLKRTMDQMGLKAVIIGQESGHGHPDYLKNVGPLAEGEFVISMTNHDLPLPGNAAYVNAFKAKYGQLPETQATFNYQAALVLKEALEKAGTDDKEAIRKALSEIELSPGPNLVVPVDRFRFDEKGNSNVGQIALQVQKGALATVWPEKIKAADIILPK